uniref:Uncharacterized protein n=1 Tax=Romanomermis culicivorax TaxID=13658 RepID=A0A915HGK5_ROMCU
MSRYRELCNEICSVLIEKQPILLLIQINIIQTLKNNMMTNLNCIKLQKTSTREKTKCHPKLLYKSNPKIFEKQLSSKVQKKIAIKFNRNQRRMKKRRLPAHGLKIPPAFKTFEIAMKFKICNPLRLCKDNLMQAISAKVASSSKGSMEPGTELFLMRCLEAFLGFPSKEGETTHGSMEPSAEEMGECERLMLDKELEDEIWLKRLLLRR